MLPSITTLLLIPCCKSIDEPPFLPLPNTPTINGLTTPGLLTSNTNLANPFRLDKSQSATVASCDPDHGYTAIQKSFDGGLMDKFVQNSGLTSQKNCDPKLVMGYFDGNTVTALWNYAQHFAMSDNFHSSNIDPSLPGHLNLIAGQTHGAMPLNITKNVANGTLIGDIDSVYDDCSTGKTISMAGKNIGDFMNEKGVTWGWFQGGFKPSNTVVLTQQRPFVVPHMKILQAIILLIMWYIMNHFNTTIHSKSSSSISNLCFNGWKNRSS